MSSVHVRSIQALIEFKSGLSQFRGETQEILDRIFRDVRKFQEYLEERQRYWQRRVEADRGDRKAEEELRNVRHWRGVVEQAVGEYQRQAYRLTGFLNHQVPKGVVYLGNQIAKLEAYNALKPTSEMQRVSASVSHAATGTVRSVSLTPEQQQLKDELIDIASKNPSIPEAYKQELPRALDMIMAITPDALGLEKKASNWGPYASAIKGRLSNSATGVGFAYELLGSAALIEKASIASNADKQLFIDPNTDRIDFEIKLNPTEIPVSETRTIEADALISRKLYENGKWSDNLEIGIDFKHVNNGGACKQNLKDEIQRIKSVIKTGQIHEFHFVTNGTFENRIAKLVDNANDDLRKSSHLTEDNLIYYHGHVTFGKMSEGYINHA
jgi:hypothetical protein